MAGPAEGLRGPWVWRDISGRWSGGFPCSCCTEKREGCPGWGTPWTCAAWHKSGTYRGHCRGHRPYPSYGQTVGSGSFGLDLPASWESPSGRIPCSLGARDQIGLPFTPWAGPGTVHRGRGRWLAARGEWSPNKHRECRVAGHWESGHSKFCCYDGGALDGDLGLTNWA